MGSRPELKTNKEGSIGVLDGATDVPMNFEADCWSTWLTEGRYRGATAAERRVMNVRLLGVRRRILRAARIRSGTRVLDAGCGDGFLAAGAANMAGPSGLVAGLDISAASLANAERLVLPSPQDASITWHLGSVTQLPFPDASFDAVVQRSVLMYVQEKRAAVAEYSRVLRKGGCVSLFEPINGEAVEDWRIDLTPVRGLHERVQAAQSRLRATTCQPMLDFDAESLGSLFRERFASVRTTAYQSRWIPVSGDEWLRYIEQQPNPLWPTHRDLIADALGPDAERYLEFIAGRMERGAYTYRCPAVFLLAST